MASFSTDDVSFSSRIQSFGKKGREKTKSIAERSLFEFLSHVWKGLTDVPHPPALAEFLERRVVLSAGGIQTVASFANYQPPTSLVRDANGNYFGLIGYPSVLEGAIVEIAAGSKTVARLASFSGLPITNPTSLTIDSSGNLFGTTSQAIFEVAYGTTAITTVATGTPGAILPGLALDATGNIFGTENQTVFEVARGSNTITPLASIAGTNISELSLDSAGNIFGTTNSAGAFTPGTATLFEIPHGATSATTLASFSVPVGGFVSALTPDADGNLFGTTVEMVFELARGSTAITTIASMPIEVETVSTTASDRVVLDSSGNLFGTATNSGIFEIAHGTTHVSTVYSPSRTVTELGVDAAGNIFGATNKPSFGEISSDDILFDIPHGTTNVKTDFTFDESGGYDPITATLDSSGNLFGATSSGGDANYGTIFELPHGASTIAILAPLSYIGPGNGESVVSGTLVLDSVGDLFGAFSGGVAADNAIFEVRHGSSTISILATFPADYTGFDASVSPTSLTIDSNGNLFGTAAYAGFGLPTGNEEVFELPHGSATLETIAEFNGLNGSDPNSVVLDSSGDLFGTTATGGASGAGTIFEIVHGTSSVTTIVSFDGTQGSAPAGALLDSSGNLYGYTLGGAPPFFTGGAETVFELAKGSTSITTLGTPAATIHGLVLDSGGDVFVESGDVAGANGGDLLEIVKGSGSATTLLPFGIGNIPTSLFLGSSGGLFGTSSGGGALGQGSVFSFVDAPAQVAFLMPPQIAVSPDVLGGTDGLQVGVEDAGGTLFTTDNSAVTLTLTGGTFDNGKTTLTANAVNGIATFKDLSITTAGSYTLTASDGLLAPTPVSFDVISVGPAATITAPDIATSNAATSTITVVYTDPASVINVTSLQASNLTVTGPSGNNLAVSFDGSTVSDNGTSVVATYTIDAPGGSFSSLDVGTYTVVLSGGSVTDGAGGGVATTTRTFVVNFSEDGSFGSSGNITLSDVTVSDVLQEQVPAAGGNAGGTFLLLVGQKTDGNSGLPQGVLEQFQADGSTPNNAFGTGGNGQVLTPAGIADSFDAAAIEPNGQIIAVGSSNGSFLVARYNSDGTLDTTFGASGFATAVFQDAMASAYGVALEADGSIIVAGSDGGVLAFARFNSAGQLDTSFDGSGATAGELTLPAVGTGEVTDVAIEPDGGIVGVGSNGSFVVAVRLNPDGTLDSTFGAAGSANVTQLASKGNTANAAIAIESGGGILITGDAGSGYGVVRLTPDGAVDYGFGTGGEVLANFNGTINAADSIVVSPAGDQFVVVGITNPGGVAQVGIAAFNPDGTANTNFGTSGQTLLPAPQISGPAPTSLSTGPHASAYHPLLIDFAFATFQNDGKLLVGASNHVTTTIRRLSTIADDLVEVGTGPVGHVGRKNVRLVPFTLDGVTVAVTVTGGSATASTQGNELLFTDVTGSPSITIKTRGGIVQVGDITVPGRLLAFNAPTAVLDGKLSVGGAIGHLHLAAINGVVKSGGGISSLTAGDISGTIAAGGVLTVARVGAVTGTIAAGQIHSLTAASLTSATILAGVNLGSDGALGGSGAAGDSFAAGTIASLTINGAVRASFVGAGVNPVNGLYGDGNDVSAGGRSAIISITIKGALDDSTRFESSGPAKKIHLASKLVSTATLAQFVKL